MRLKLCQHLEALTVWRVNPMLEPARGIIGRHLIEETRSLAISETAAFVESLLGQVDFGVEVSETTSYADIFSTQVSFAVTVSEAATLLESIARRLLWEIINDSQTVDWQNVNAAQSTTWENINTSQPVDWSNINNT
jgi:hypothetical protein